MGSHTKPQDLTRGLGRFVSQHRPSPSGGGGDGAAERRGHCLHCCERRTPTPASHPFDDRYREIGSCCAHLMPCCRAMPCYPIMYFLLLLVAVRSSPLMVFCNE